MIPRDNMTDKITSVKIDVEKWEILKNKGYKLQNIVDNAFNNLLDIESYDNKELIKIKEDKQQQLKSVELMKEKSILEYDENIKNLKLEIKNLEDKINKNNELKIKEDKKRKYENEKNKELREVERIVYDGESYIGIEEMEQNSTIMDYCEKYNITVQSLLMEIIEKTN